MKIYTAPALRKIVFEMISKQGIPLQNQNLQSYLGKKMLLNRPTKLKLLGPIEK